MALLLLHHFPGTAETAQQHQGKPVPTDFERAQILYHGLREHGFPSTLDGTDSSISLFCIALTPGMHGELVCCYFAVIATRMPTMRHEKTGAVSGNYAKHRGAHTIELHQQRESRRALN
jgi:hypothetical protein